MKRALVVSLHDVSPRTRGPCERIIAGLRSAGIGRLSLLVIPDHHHRGHFAGDAAFCEWLRALVAQGHEAVVHGYFHERPARAGESLRDRLVTRSYTAGEGEFYDLDFAAARELAGKARGEFEQAGLHPLGFIAPAWLLSAEAERALRELGFSYTTRLRSVTGLRDGTVHPCQSLCWSVRAAWRRAVSRAWNAFLFSRMRSAPLLRIAVHPVDIAHPAVWRQIVRIAASANATREAMTYAQWIAESTGDTEPHHVR